MEDKIKEILIKALETIGVDGVDGIPVGMTDEKIMDYACLITDQILALFPKAGEDGLLTDEAINKASTAYDDTFSNSSRWWINEGRNIAKAQKALDDKRWIEGIEKIAEIRFELEEHGKIVDKLYQFTDRSWQELKSRITEEK